MTVDQDLCFSSAVDLMARMKARDLSPIQLMENTLARIDQVNPTLNCFCFVYPEEALAGAREAEARYAKGGAQPPLLGLPIAFKDLTPTKGKRTTLGSKAFRNWVPDEDAPIVESFKRAGAIIVGKTTTPEFAFGSFTDSPLWGITRNPWNLGRTPGGSSGGSGAAVASGCLSLAEGSDMGGSIRIPASFCGIVGLKPSFGRIPFTAGFSLIEQINHYGPLARTITDARLFLSVAQGPDERDINSNPLPLDFSGALNRSVKGLRLAVSADLNTYALDPDVRAAFGQAIAVLKDAGAEIEEVALPWSRRIGDAWWDYWQVYMATAFGDAYDAYAADLDPRMRLMIENGRRFSAVEHRRIDTLRKELWESLLPIFGRCHALLTPTMAKTAPKVDASDTDFMGEDDKGMVKAIAMTEIFNFIGQCPALSVPIGLDSERLPMGLQIVARRFDDDMALRIGAAVEDFLPPLPRPPEFH